MQKAGITNVGHGEFMVESQSSSTESYKVQFGDLSTMPSCTCFDWLKHHWPCKHFLAIYNHFPEWDWDRMSPSYTSGPYFKIVIPVDSDTDGLESDFSLLCSTSSNSTSCSLENVPQVNNAHSQILDEVLDEDPDKANDPEERSNSETHDLQWVTNPKHKGKFCGEILKEIQNLSYLCSDGNALKNYLQKLLINFKQHIPSENGILVEISKSTQKSKKQIKQTNEQKTTRKGYAKLPLRLKSKNNDSIDVSSPVKKNQKSDHYP